MLMASGDFDALLPTQGQAWLFAAGRHLLPHAAMAVAAIAAFNQVQSKIAFAALLDTLGFPQPARRLVRSVRDLESSGSR